MKIPFNFYDSLFLLKTLNMYVPFWLNQCIQVRSSFHSLPFFVFTFTILSLQTNKCDAKKSLHWQIIPCQVSSVHCLVPPETLKNNLTCKCNSGNYFDILKATDLKADVEFGVKDVTLNRNYSKERKGYFLWGKSTGIQGNCTVYWKWNSLV